MVHNYSNPERTCNMQEDEMEYEAMRRRWTIWSEDVVVVDK